MADVDMVALLKTEADISRQERIDNMMFNRWEARSKAEAKAIKAKSKLEKKKAKAKAKAKLTKAKMKREAELQRREDIIKYAHAFRQNDNTLTAIDAVRAAKLVVE